jgi:hypothetical protein
MALERPRRKVATDETDAPAGVVMQRENREASNAGASSDALKVAPAHRKRNSPFEQGPVTIAALQCNK